MLSGGVKLLIIISRLIVMPAKSFISAFSAVFVDVLGNILKRVTAKRSRARIVDKILSMGLVSDRRDLYKKRQRSAPGRSTGMVRPSTYTVYTLHINMSVKVCVWKKRSHRGVGSCVCWVCKTHFAWRWAQNFFVALSVIYIYIYTGTICMYFEG